MQRPLQRLLAGLLAVGFAFALGACASLPGGDLPAAQSTHDYVGGEN